MFSSLSGIILCMDVCSPLREYAWLVDAVRRHQAEMNNLEAAVDTAIDEMPDDFMIKQFLIGNRAEVKALFFIEYDEKRACRDVHMAI